MYQTTAEGIFVHFNLPRIELDYWMEKKIAERRKNRQADGTTETRNKGSRKDTGIQSFVSIIKIKVSVFSIKKKMFLVLKCTCITYFVNIKEIGIVGVKFGKRERYGTSGGSTSNRHHTPFVVIVSGSCHIEDY